MDWGSYALGFGTAAGIAIAIPIVRGIQDYRYEQDKKRIWFNFGTKCLDNDTIDLARAIGGIQCHYSFIDKNNQQDYLTEFEDKAKDSLDIESEQLSRNLRPLLPERQRAAKELIDIVSYLKKNNT
jgi:hypothetical protein